MAKVKNEVALRNLMYHSEQETWKGMSLEHRGYRTALWRLLAENMYAVGDYYVPADELFFGTSALADEVLEVVIRLYDFKHPKKIIVKQSRYERGDRAGSIIDIPDYLDKEKQEADLLYIAGDKFRVVVTEHSEEIIIAIF